MFHCVFFDIFEAQSKCRQLRGILTAQCTHCALHWLAREKIELMTGELRQLVERATQDREAAIIGLEGAVMFGSSHMIDMIVQHTKDHSIFEENKQKLWISAVNSDTELTVSTLLHLRPNPPLEGSRQIGSWTVGPRGHVFD